MSTPLIPSRYDPASEEARGQKRQPTDFGLKGFSLSFEKRVLLTTIQSPFARRSRGG
jgi:hypothetical protein